MKNYLFIIACLPLFTGCNAIRNITGAHANGTGSSAPTSVVVDGQSNGERLPTGDLLKAFAAVGYSNLAITNVAAGGTTLRQHMWYGDAWADSVTPAGRGLYNVNVPKIKAAAPSIYIWWQGEAEAAYGATGKDTYGRDLADLVRDLRTKTGINFTFIYVKLSKNMAVGVSPAFPQGTPFWQTVRDQQDSLGIPNSLSINIDDLHGDGLHYYPDEYQTVAARIARAVASGQSQ